MTESVCHHFPRTDIVRGPISWPNVIRPSGDQQAFSKDSPFNSSSRRVSASFPSLEVWPIASCLGDARATPAFTKAIRRQFFPPWKTFDPDHTQNNLQNRRRRAITTLVLVRLPLAGFAVITYGRFSGDREGASGAEYRELGPLQA